MLGPTASGKSSVAVSLATKLNGEIISADSRQVYRGLNIGTGKITQKEMRGVRHHLLDVALPKKIYSAADYLSDGSKALESILKRGKLPIICGGTGFYIDALMGRVSLPHVAPNNKLRIALSKKSAAELFKKLEKIDPTRAKTIDRYNPVRLIRALEIAAAQSHPKPQKDALRVAQEKRALRMVDFSIIWVGLAVETELLQKKIHNRLVARIKGGLIKEVKLLHEKGLSWLRMNSLGLEYRYVAAYLQKKITKEEMMVELELKIWQYAKRQRTYWRRNKDILWLSNSEVLSKEFLSKFI